MSEKMETIRSFVRILAEIVFVLALVAASFYIDDLRTEKVARGVVAEAMAKQYAGYSLPTQAIPPRGEEMPIPDEEPVTKAQPEGKKDDSVNFETKSPMSTPSPKNDIVESLLKAESSWDVKTTSYPEYHSKELTTEWAADTSYCVRMDMPRVMFQNLEQNHVEVVYPENVRAGEEGTIVIRVKNKGSGAEYVARMNLTATDDLKIVYGSDHPQVAYGGELDYGYIGDGKSLVIHFYTGATSEHYKNRGESHSWTSARGSLSARFYRV